MSIRISTAAKNRRIAWYAAPVIYSLFHLWFVWEKEQPTNPEAAYFELAFVTLILAVVAAVGFFWAGRVFWVYAARTRADVLAFGRPAR